MSACLTIPFTIKFLQDNNWSEITKECRNINLWARKEINNILDKKSICDEKFLGQMSSIYIRKEATIDYHIYFYKKYKIQIPFILWNNISFIRISIQVYNTKEDVYKLLDALKKEML
jgi:selenocysteine lyase/cysteine desulfurase